MNHVAYCIDKNYLQHFSASLTSLLINYSKPSDDLCVHIVTSDSDEAFESVIVHFRNTYRATFIVHNIPPAYLIQLENAPVKTEKIQHVTIVSYFRLFLGDILPAEIDKVVYLDSDTIILSSIHDLIDTDLGTAVIAGVPDLHESDCIAHAGTKRYINTGALLLDLSQWRTRDCTNRCLHYINSPDNRIRYLDQCTINIALENEITIIEDIWNNQIHMGKTQVAITDDRILHFVTPNKPWHAWYDHPFAKYYWRYLECTPFKDTPPVKPSNLPQAWSLARQLYNQKKYAESVAIYDDITSKFYQQSINRINNISE
ncbi:MAG: glycosyltransferase family 8 protein [Hydrogenophilales bacterium]|nr:glycosyltransferase family 8 protein [Hydrogenophilales bacterium]